MKINTTSIDGAYLIDLDVFGDERGYFLESYHHRKYVEQGLNVEFVQDNRSQSKKNVLRGLHYQIEDPSGHLIYVTHGKVFDVGVDLRKSSPTFGETISFVLTADKPQQLYLPAGVAHGFCTLNETNEILYKCTTYYNPEDEAGLLWNDPDLGIRWPVKNPDINERDAQYPRLKDIQPSNLPVMNKECEI